MSNQTLSPPLKWHGGKHYLAKRIVALMPPHTHYVEPFAGGLSVLLAKHPEGVSEVTNDLSGELSNFWQVLRHPALFERFVRQVQAIPFSEAEWVAANEIAEHAGYEQDPVEAAVTFFVRCRQSMAGRLTNFAPLSRTRTRRGMNEQAAAWLTAVEGLPAVHARLKRVVVLNRDALEVIRTQDGPETLFYLDPPYLHSTRTATSVYAHEMSVDDHVKLLAAVKQASGKVMLSGYASPMYHRALSTWTRHTFDLPNNAAGGASKRRVSEVLWCNF